ncbi:response regulator [candidate division WOR-3 bacterium]|nr:response regulator [candidate division WOR-3 bacterium]
MNEKGKHSEKNADITIMNVLLIEDASFAVTFIRETLAYCEEAELVKDTKFALTNVETLGEALKCISEHEFDLILLDLNLPDSKELATLDSIRKNAHNVPVVVITALSDEGLALEAMKRGAEGFLVKGQMGVNALLQAIFFAVERHQILMKLEEKIRELERSKSRFKNIIERIHFAVVVVDRKGIVQFANSSSQNFLEAVPEDLIGEKFEFPLEVGQLKEIEVRSKGKEKKRAEMRVTETEWEGDGAYLVMMRNIKD